MQLPDSQVSVPSHLQCRGISTEFINLFKFKQYEVVYRNFQKGHRAREVRRFGLCSIWFCSASCVSRTVFGDFITLNIRDLWRQQNISANSFSMTLIIGSDFYLCLWHFDFARLT